MPTIKDVAREAGVSVGTVSRYLNGAVLKEQNQRRIDAAVARLGYRRNALARSMKTGRSMLVGVIVPALSNMFSMRVIEGVEPACEEVELREGDVIVMGSDGAMDSGEGAVERALAREWSLPPERLSEELLRAAEAACEGRRDDMTVLCVRIAPARARAP